MQRRYGTTWLAAVVATVTIVSSPVHAGESRLAGARPAVRSRLEISFNLRPGGAGKEAGAVALGGALVTVVAVGKPGTMYTVQLGYDNKVVRQVPLRLGKKGLGECNFRAPDVRVRAECELVVIGKGKTVRRKLVVLPAAALAGSAARIRQRRLGVIDGRGGIQAALKAEGVAFENLATRLEQDAFTGGIVIVAGFSKANALAEACLRLESRVTKGATVIVVNPPEGWSGWGLSVRKLPAALDGPVFFAQGFGELIRRTDIGVGPRFFVLEKRKRIVDDARKRSGAVEEREEWKALTWVNDTKKDRGGKDRNEAHPLVAARRVGKGLAVVARMRGMECPATGAAGRRMLDEIVLWVLKESYGDAAMNRR